MEDELKPPAFVRARLRRGLTTNVDLWEEHGTTSEARRRQLLETPRPTTAPTTLTVRSRPAIRHTMNPVVLEASAATVSAQSTSTKGQVVPKPRKRGRLCKAEGCEKYIVHKGLCCSHGGGKRCSVDGCHASAKHRGLCWRHGGSTECKVHGCTNRAKAKGVCWSHGGGTQCHHLEGCIKIAVSGGLCWAHGGGKRCIHDECQRPAFERTHGFCEKHHRELQNVDYYEV